MHVYDPWINPSIIAYPFTADKATPRIMNFWKIKKTMIGGKDTINRIANLILVLSAFTLITYL